MPAQDTLLSRMLSTRSGLRTAALLVLAGTSPAAGAVSPEAAGAGEWRAWGGSPGGIRFSALRQIDRVNVARLEPAWTYRTGELLLGLAHSPWRASFNATPLVVRGMLYLSTPSSRVIALEPETGKEAWSFDPQKDKAVREFNAFNTPQGNKFANEYEVYSQKFQKEDFGDDEPFDPKVLPNEYLTAPKSTHTFVYVSTIQRMARNLFGAEGCFAQSEVRRGKGCSMNILPGIEREACSKPSTRQKLPYPKLLQ